MATSTDGWRSPPATAWRVCTLWVWLALPSNAFFPYAARFRAPAPTVNTRFASFPLLSRSDGWLAKSCTFYRIYHARTSRCLTNTVGFCGFVSLSSLPFCLCLPLSPVFLFSRSHRYVSRKASGVLRRPHQRRQPSSLRLWRRGSGSNDGFARR